MQLRIEITEQKAILTNNGIITYYLYTRTRKAPLGSFWKFTTDTKSRALNGPYLFISVKW